MVRLHKIQSVTLNTLNGKDKIMFKKICLTMVAVLAMVSISYATTNVSGDINVPTLWTIEGSPYNLSGRININATLTINDGVIVNGTSDTDYFVLYGTLIAQGNPDDRIVFNSVDVVIGSNSVLKLDHNEWNGGYLRNNLGFEHYSITNCIFNQAKYLRLNARTDSYFDKNILNDCQYIVIILYGNFDRKLYYRWNCFYGFNSEIQPRTNFIVAYEQNPERLIIKDNNFMDSNDFVMRYHDSVYPSTVIDLTFNYWNTTDENIILDRILGRENTLYANYYSNIATGTPCSPVLDTDGDGIYDNDDVCVNTKPDELTNDYGCSINDMNPCNGDWINHGDYVNSVKDTALQFVDDGLLKKKDVSTITSIAAQSDCGTKEKFFVEESLWTPNSVGNIIGE